MKFRLLFLCILFASNSFSQDYIAYQKTFNRIDDDVAVSDFNTAIARLDSVYKHYDFVYAKHCVKALQISVTAGDSIRADRWLAKCFKQGVPLWLVENNAIAKKALHYQSVKNTLAKKDSLFQIYKHSVNHGIARQIDSLLAIDQKITDQINNGFWLWRVTFYNWKWKRNNRRQFETIKSITEQYGFPGERLIGIDIPFEPDSAAIKAMALYGPNLVNRKTTTMLLHYFSSKREDVDGLLRPFVAAGYLPADQYASINDFLAEWGKRKYRNQYYNAWHFAPDGNLDAIDERRNAIGLNRFEKQEQNGLTNRQRRVDKKANSEIILE